MYSDRIFCLSAPRYASSGSAQPCAAHWAGRITSIRITSSTESLDDNTVDRYCCCTSDVAPPTSTSTFTFGLRFWYSSAIFRITSGRCCPPVKMRSVVCCAYTVAENVRLASDTSTSFHVFIVPPDCDCERFRLPVGAADRNAGLRVEQVKVIQRERHRQRGPCTQRGIGREPPGHLAGVRAGPDLDERERIGAERLDEHHAPVDGEHARLAGSSG